jgi:ABC-type transport system involved in cytochrome c biogenesis permease component
MSVISDLFNRMRLSGLAKNRQQMTGLISILHLSKVESGSGGVLISILLLSIYIPMSVSLTTSRAGVSRARGFLGAYSDPCIYLYMEAPPLKEGRN